MLPDYVNLIFLSATTPNTIDFSDWIGRTKRKPVHVIRTNYRPVPLSHYLYAGLKLHKLMEGKGGFSDAGWKKASMALLPASERSRLEQQGGKKGGVNTTAGGGGGGSKARGKQTTAPSFRKSSGSKHSAWQQSGSRQDWTALVKYLDREGLMPTVVFSFSKKVRGRWLASLEPLWGPLFFFKHGPTSPTLLPFPPVSKRRTPLAEMRGNRKFTAYPRSQHRIREERGPRFRHTDDGTIITSGRNSSTGYEHV